MWQYDSKELTAVGPQRPPDGRRVGAAGPRGVDMVAREDQGVAEELDDLLVQVAAVARTQDAVLARRGVLDGLELLQNALDRQTWQRREWLRVAHVGRALRDGHLCRRRRGAIALDVGSRRVGRLTLRPATIQNNTALSNRRCRIVVVTLGRRIAAPLHLTIRLVAPCTTIGITLTLTLRSVAITKSSSGRQHRQR